MLEGRVIKEFLDEELGEVEIPDDMSSLFKNGKELSFEEYPPF